MTISYNAPLKTTRMQAVVAAIDAAAPPATIEIGQAGMAPVLCVITLGDPSFTVAGDTITMTGVPKSGVATTSGTAQEARIKAGDGTIIVSGLSVGTSGTDIILNNVGITAGQTITITSGTIQHAP